MAGEFQLFPEPQIKTERRLFSSYLRSVQSLEITHLI
jgi:hypothetical protein